MGPLGALAILDKCQGACVSQEGVIPLTEGQKASADDRPNAQRIAINWMVDSNETVRQRPAISSSTFFPGTYNRKTGLNTGLIGIYVWTNAFNRRDYLVYVRQDRTIWALDLLTGVVTALSTAGVNSTLLDGGASQVVFAEDTQRLYMAGGGQIQTWTPPATLSTRLNTYTAVTNQVPLAATHVLSVANYIVANQVTPTSLGGQFFWSAIGDANHTTGWSAINFNTADADPDPILALGANLREVYAFGTKTTQVFGIGADPTLPFISSMAISVGCGAAYSVIRVDDQWAMLDDSRRFVFTNGRGYNVISDDVVKLIRDFTTVSDCIGFRARVGYWDLLVWVFPTEGKAYCYDRRLQNWWQWRGWNGLDDFSGIRANCSAYWTAGNLTFVGDPSFENIWTLDTATFSDTGPGLPIVAERVTERLDWGTASRKVRRRVRFLVKRGIATTTPAYLDVAKRDDDGPWSSYQTLNLGVAGDYASYADWYPGGIYRRTQYRIRYSSGVDVAVTKAIEFWDAVAD